MIRSDHLQQAAEVLLPECTELATVARKESLQNE